MAKAAEMYTSAKMIKRLTFAKRLPARYLDPRVAAYIRHKCKEHNMNLRAFFRQIQRVNPKLLPDGVQQTHGYHRNMLHNMESGVNWDGISLSFIIRVCETFGTNFSDFCKWYAKTYND